jgi:hypothetical protein
MTRMGNDSPCNIYPGRHTFIIPLQYVTEATKNQTEGIRAESGSHTLIWEDNSKHSQFTNHPTT